MVVEVVVQVYVVASVFALTTTTTTTTTTPALVLEEESGNNYFGGDNNFGGDFGGEGKGAGEAVAAAAAAAPSSSSFVTLLLTTTATTTVERQYTLQVAGPLVLAMLIVHAADLAVQRAVGAVLFLGLSCWLLLFEQDITIERGMRWAAPLLCFKFLVSHVPRYEPYV
jgi:hypothetical protein